MHARTHVHIHTYIRTYVHTYMMAACLRGNPRWPLFLNKLYVFRGHSSVTQRFFSGNWTPTHPDNNIEHYTFVTPFSRKSDTPPPSAIKNLQRFDFLKIFVIPWGNAPPKKSNGGVVLPPFQTEVGGNKEQPPPLG